MSEYPVLLLRHDTGQTVEATLIEDVPLYELAGVDRAWRSALEEATRRMRRDGAPDDRFPQHGHWRWDAKGRYAQVFPGTYRIYGIRAGGEMQALMMTATDRVCRVESQSGRPLVYVDYLESAPWNLPGLIPRPRYRGAGSVLIAAAISQSREAGSDGRIGLHALPNIEGWYARHCGMTDLGNDMGYHGLRYFEMTSDQAFAFYPGDPT